jgi:carboxyl-terminal processing protease
MKQGFIKVYHLPLYLALTLIIGIFLGKNFFASSATFARTSGNDSTYNEALNLAEILQLVQENYVDSVDAKDLARKGIANFLHELDPHSVYIPANKVDKANENLEGSFDGIGLEFILMQDTIVAFKAVKGGPAEKAGLLAGDKIVMIDSKPASFRNMKADDVIGKLRGKRGSAVMVKVKRNGVPNFLSITITRAEIPLYSVEAAFMLDSSTAYFKIDQFSRTTMDELKATYPYNNTKVKKVVLDLRGNGGGYLNTCTQLADEFLKDGELIVYTKDRTHEERKMFATKDGKFENAKLYVFIDGESASASEIFAGAMQDNDRATIIGARSFGKGLVQEVFSLSDGSQVRLTISRYYTPSGRSIQKPYKDVAYEDYSLSQYANDSIADTTAYFTKSKRKVYGGGGIFPDVKVKQDTLAFWKELSVLYKNDFARECALRAIIAHRKQWSAFSVIQFARDKMIDAEIRTLINAEAHTILSSAALDYLLKEVKGNVIRSLWGNNAYYQYRLVDDKYLKKIN